MTIESHEKNIITPSIRLLVLVRIAKT